MKYLYTFTIVLLSFYKGYSQDYCLQAQPLSIDPVGSCSSISVSLGADLNDQDDIGGGINITTFNSACINPSGSNNVYWGSFTGTGNDVTIKALNPDRDGVVVVFENEPCTATMSPEYSCFNF